MKNKSLFVRLICTFSVLFVLFVTIGSSRYIVNQLKTSDKVSDKDDVIDDGDTVTLSFKYAVCTDITKTEYKETVIEGYEKVTISDETTYDNFFTYINSITSNGPVSETTIDAGSYSYIGKGDVYSGTIIILEVTTQIKYTEACGTTPASYGGVYTLYSKKNTTYVKSYDYYGNDVKEKINVAKNKLLTGTDISDLLSLTAADKYKFVGLIEENEDGTPSDTAVSLPITVAESKIYYAVFNKSEMASISTYHLGKTISSYTAKGEYTFNEYFDSADEFNLMKDSSYFEKENIIFLGDKNSTITTSSGETVVGTKIASGVTINFGLNSGDVTIAGKHTTIHDIEPEDSNHTNQYTICLQSDLYLYGTLVIGANYGTTANTNYEGHIADEYVTLDLNGHNIYVENGTLNVYGLIKNSKTAGEVIAHGGYVYTLAVIYDYRGGTATTTLVGKNVLPFQIYSLPYFRCKLRICNSENGWCQLIARCVVQTTKYSQTEILINFLGGLNDTVLFKISPQEDSYVEIEGTKNKQITEGKNETSNEVKFCLSQRLKISFFNCSVQMSNIIINPGAEVDTINFSFPVSSFFDILLVNTNMTFSQSIKLMPGMSLIADKDSNIIMSFDSANNKSAQISVLGNSAYYYDSEKMTMVKKDVIDVSQFTNSGEVYFESESLWKYYSQNRVKIYGALVFQGGNVDVREYLLAGEMDFNRVAYSSDGTTTNLEYIDYSADENPFAKLMEKHSDVKIVTYGYEYMVGGTNCNAVMKGYSRPLVSYGKGYYTNGTSEGAKVGDYSFRTGIFKISDSEMYYFNIGTTFSLADNSTCALNACTYDEDEHTFTDTSTNTKYAYFASSYYPYTNTDGTITLDVTRSNSSTTSVTVAYDSTLDRWLRK